MSEMDMLYLSLNHPIPITTNAQSSLSSSFTPSHAPTRPKSAEEVGPTQAAGTVPAEPETESTPVPGMDEWKSTYDNYVEHWQAESAVARKVALENRKFYEDAAAAEEKKAKDEAAAKKRAEAKEKKDREGAERLRKELAEGSVENKKSRKQREQEEREEREKKMREAWELVKGAGPSSSGQGEKAGVVHVGDARGVMDEDVKAGQAVVEGQKKERVEQVRLALFIAASRGSQRSYILKRSCKLTYTGRVRPNHLHRAPTALHAD